MRWSNHLAQFCVCASVLLVPFVAQAASEDDPWESINRPIYKFNDVLDTYALKPLAQGYQFVTPQFLEDGIHNMFRNVGDVTNLANDILQAKPAAAGVDTARMIFNTTFGCSASSMSAPRWACNAMTKTSVRPSVTGASAAVRT
jgi:phospholipid-binding lipoprotein MlaA